MPNYKQVIKSLEALTPMKQALVLETWPGPVGETPEGFRVTARSVKELRRLTHDKDPEMLDWIHGFELGEVFYDIGANVGALTFSAAGMHGDRVRIVAIEPGYESFESLTRNLSLNNLLGFTIPLQVAMLDCTSLQPMNYQTSTAAGTSLHAVGKAVDYEGHEFTPVEVQIVPTYTLDDLIEVMGLPLPSRIKIDVDGYEEAVLRGATGTLAVATVRDLVVEVVNHDRQFTRLKAVESLLRRDSYELVRTFQHPSHGQGESYVADYLFRRQSTGGTGRRAIGETANRSSDVLDATDAAARKARADAAARKARARAKREHLARELHELRGSYYLSGAAKKIDLRQIEGFSEIARRLRDDGRSGMDLDRLHMLWQAARGAPVGKPIVEVGAYKGGSAKFIAEALRHAGRSPRFYVCDTFTGHPRVDPDIDPLVHQSGAKFQDTSFEEVSEYLADYPNIEIVAGDIIKTSKQLVRESFGLVHIDVDVYPATEFCLRFFAPRLARGGVMIVDDYGFVTCPGAKRAVDEFVTATPAFRMLHLLSGQAILFRVRPPEKRWAARVTWARLKAMTRRIARRLVSTRMRRS